MKDALLQLAALDLHGDARFGADVGIAMRMLRPDVMAGRCELPPWLTAHIDTCEKCGIEKVWKHRAFGSDVWIDGQSFESGQGWHGCLNCSEV